MGVIGLDSFGIGRLFISEIATPFEFQPYEVSAKYLGLIIASSFVTLAKNNQIFIELKDRKVPLKIDSFHSMESDSIGLVRVKFEGLDPSINLEQTLINYEQFNKIGPKNQNYIQSARFSLDNPIVAVGKTFGSVLGYPLAVENISKSGLLLCTDNKIKAPFIVNTLLELKLLSDQNLLDSPVNCLAKVVRIHTRGSKGFGVKFIELDGDLRSTVFKIVESLEVS